MPTTSDPPRSSIFPRASASVQLAVERLNQASSALRSLLDQPIPYIMEPNYQEEEYAAEAENNRAKRRKLDIEGGFRYGYRGEVVPGPLQMRILSCDGGYHQDGSSQGRAYGQENILRNDKSVYCTYKNRCNVVLCHQGESPFTVKKIIIKAPPRGFTSPIQEGMIFISMDAKDLLARTAQYQIREESPAPPAYDRPFALEDSENETTVDLNTHDSAANGRPPSRRTEATPPFPIPPGRSPNVVTATDVTLSPPGAPPARSRRVAGSNRVRRFSEDHDINLARVGYETSDAYSHHAVRRNRRYHGMNRDTPSVVSLSVSSNTFGVPRGGIRARQYHNRNAAPASPQPSPLSQAQAASSEAQIDFNASSLQAPPISPSIPQQDKFVVTMDCSDASDDDEELSSPDILADLFRRDRTLYIDHSPELDLASEDDDDEETATSLRALRNHNARIAASQGLGRRELPSRVQVVNEADIDDEEPDGGHGVQNRTIRRNAAKEKGVLAPHARFFIEKEKSSVSVTFAPEVSGRYILLKLWSTTKAKNIDIQSVIVKGFAGPRFFPTAQFL